MSMESNGHKWGKKCFIRFNWTVWLGNEPRLGFQTWHLERQAHCAAFLLMQLDSRRINSECKRHTFPQVETHPDIQTRSSFVYFLSVLESFLLIPTEISSFFFFHWWISCLLPPLASSLILTSATPQQPSLVKTWHERFAVRILFSWRPQLHPALQG